MLAFSTQVRGFKHGRSRRSHVSANQPSSDLPYKPHNKVHVVQIVLYLRKMGSHKITQILFALPVPCYELRVDGLMMVDWPENVAKIKK